MSAGQSNPNELKLLPPNSNAQSPTAGEIATPTLPTPLVTTPLPPSIASPATPPARQLADLPKDELETLAEEYGLDARKFKTSQDLVAAIHARRQLMASLDRHALLDVVRWGRRPVPLNASAEQLALEILRIKSMRFDGLSERGLIALARLRGVEIIPGDPVPAIIKKLKKQEGFFTRLNRKRRGLIGSLVSNMIGDDAAASEYQFLPPAQGADPAASTGTVPPPRDRTIKEDIEESGLFGGIANRVKKSADQYINQKLDEIESRIDRKLDEIDRRLAEWRDKEIANRLRILKITLWASVIVASLSLVYTYIRANFPGVFKSGQTVNKTDQTR